MPDVTVRPEDILDALAEAQPGDTVYFEGTWQPRGDKIRNVRGRDGAPVTLAGTAQDRAIISGAGASVFAARIDDCAWFSLGNCTVEDCTAREQRGLQVFTSENVKVYDLLTRGIVCDHLHFAGCNHVLVKRHWALGKGGEDMGGGKGPHALYFTRVDGGGDCADLVAEDCRCEDVLGSAYQANGDGGWLSGVVFRRCKAVNYGEMGGSGFNLAQCRAPLLEDVTLVKHPRNGNPGVNSFDGTTGTMMRRYAIDASPQWAGPMADTPGDPAPPQFGTPPPPDGGNGGGGGTDWEAKYNEERALNDARDSWYAQFPQREHA